MISLGDKNCIPFRGDKRPLQITQGDKTVFAPRTTTVSGEGVVSVADTYNDNIQLLAVTGACEQTVTTVGKNLADSAVRFMQNPDYYVWEQQNWIVPESGQTYYISFSGTFASMYFYARFEDGTIKAKVGAYSATGKWFTVADNVVSVQGYNLTYTDTIAALYVYANGQEANGFGADVVGQLELGSTATAYEPFTPDSPTPDYPSEIRSVGGAATVADADGNQPTTIDLPDLYAVGDVADVMCVDHSQRRRWVEHKIDPDLLTDTELVDEQTGAILDTPVIEELDYTALPTHYKGTVITYDPDDGSVSSAVVEATVKTWTEVGNDD